MRGWAWVCVATVAAVWGCGPSTEWSEVPHGEKSGRHLMVLDGGCLALVDLATGEPRTVLDVGREGHDWDSSSDVQYDRARNRYYYAAVADGAIKQWDPVADTASVLWEDTSGLEVHGMTMAMAPDCSRLFVKPYYNQRDCPPFLEIDLATREATILETVCPDASFYVFPGKPWLCVSGTVSRSEFRGWQPAKPNPETDGPFLRQSPFRLNLDTGSISDDLPGGWGNGLPGGFSTVFADFSPEGHWVLYCAFAPNGAEGWMVERLDENGQGTGETRRLRSLDNHVWGNYLARFVSETEVAYPRWVEMPVGGKDFIDWVCIYDIDAQKQYSVPGVHAHWMKLVEIGEGKLPPAIDRSRTAPPYPAAQPAETDTAP